MSLLLAKWSVSRVAWTIRVVDCEACGGRYYYEIARAGEGSGTSMMWLDNEGARRRAAERAHDDATADLQTAHDPVPCPYCGHVQAVAIRELAWARMVTPMGVLLLVAAVGVLVPVVMGVRDVARGADPAGAVRAAAVVGGPVVALLLAALAFCRWRIRRFNRDRFDALPAGHKYRLAPPALVEVDPNVIAPAAPVHSLRRGRWLMVQTHRIGLPPYCMSCGAAAERMFRPPIALSHDSASYPCCERCQPARSLWWAWTALKAAAVMLALMAAVAWVPWSTSSAAVRWAVASVIGVLVVPLLAIVAANMLGWPLSTRRVFAARGWFGLRSRNPRYDALIEARYSEAAWYEHELQPHENDS